HQHVVTITRTALTQRVPLYWTSTVLLARIRSLPGSLAVRAAARIFQGYSAPGVRDFVRCAEQTASAQATVLRRLAVATARTEYGRSHGITADADYRAWRDRLPVVD